MNRKYSSVNLELPQPGTRIVPGVKGSVDIELYPWHL